MPPEYHHSSVLGQGPGRAYDIFPERLEVHRGKCVSPRLTLVALVWVRSTPTCHPPPPALIPLQSDSSPAAVHNSPGFSSDGTELPAPLACAQTREKV
ncbi:hypothetical protein WMY93_003851 [Mugilogobius chulae]|uniref:Uncharacterized protein n=1 Tax=Mugilogobius chulae TaxID=88201 RepID=A0AAW0PYS0_9GOBI